MLLLVPSRYQTDHHGGHRRPVLLTLTLARLLVQRTSSPVDMTGFKRCRCPTPAAAAAAAAAAASSDDGRTVEGIAFCVGGDIVIWT